jgi:hypothetical protein
MLSQYKSPPIKPARLPVIVSDIVPQYPAGTVTLPQSVVRINRINFSKSAIWRPVSRDPPRNMQNPADVMNTREKEM